MKDEIVIQCWSGRVLFDGHYKDKQVDVVLDANRCDCRHESEVYHEITVCPDCDDTGYSGDFEVYWKDENDEQNVYECINY